MKRKYRVLICILQFKRDYASAFIMAKIFEKFGAECLISHSSNYRSKLFQLWNPDAVILGTSSRILRIKEYWEAQHFYNWLESSTTAGHFTNKIVLTMNKYVLCLWDKNSGQKSLLTTNDIKELWIWSKELN